MPLGSTNLTLFCSISKVLHKQASTQTKCSTHQLLHRPPTLHRPTSAEANFYTNQLFHKPTFRQTRFYTTTFYCTDQLLHQPALHNPCFGPGGQRPDGRQNAAGCCINTTTVLEKNSHLQPLNSVPEGHKMSHLVIGQTKQGFGRS